MREGYVDRPLEVPCGKCVGCQLERSRQWAVRCVHESKLHLSNLFVTLTYDDEHLPRSGSLVPEHFVLFMKRLRHLHPGVRFFQCGEYGSELGRPHHHAILFNCNFPDRKHYKDEGSSRLFTSEQLDRLWGHGFCNFGEASFESAQYVAKYTLKAVTGPDADVVYGSRVRPYLTMSRRPGIGRQFIEKYNREIYQSDSVIIRGVPCRPPRFYDNVQETLSPGVLRTVKAKRRVAAAENPDNTPRRLIVREESKVRELNVKTTRS